MFDRTGGPALTFARFSGIDHAWHIMIAAAVVSLLTVGTRFATGPFVAPILADLGLSHTQFSTIVSISLLLFGLGMPISGRLADLYGGRLVLTVGGAVLSLSLAISAWTDSPTVFAIAFGGISSIGFAATSHVTLSAVIGRWFVKRRGLAMTALSSGGMGGIALMTPLSSVLIQQMGWRATLVTFAVIILALIAFAALVMGASPPGESGADTSAGSRRAISPPAESWTAALTTAPFWLLAASFFTCGFSMSVLGTHGVPMLEHHGFPTMTASFGIGLIGFVSIFGSLALGIASDRVGRQVFLALIYGVRGIGFLGLIVAGQVWELYAVTALGGLVWAGSSALTSALVADTYGPRNVGILFGLIFLSHQVGGSIGSFLGGWGFDSFGTYSQTFILTAFLLFTGAYISWRVPRPQILRIPTVIAEGD